MALTQAQRAKIYRVKNADKVRAADAERKRKSRVKREAKNKNPESPDDPAQAIFEWARDRLVVPPGHKNEGKPFTLPQYGVDFIRDVFKHKETLLCCARKNSKSGIVAVLILAHLANDGPVRRLGWRGGVLSVTKEKAHELRRQCEGIAAASGLKEISFLRTAAPSIVSRWGAVDVLSSSSESGSASGFDIALIDELGLFKETHRALINSMKSSLSARGGRFVSLSIHGDGPFIPKIIERHEAGEPELAVHLYQGIAGRPLMDEENWNLASPGLKAGIKDIENLRASARACEISTSDIPFFETEELNLPGSSSREPLVSTVDWEKCEYPVDKLPPRSGACVVGYDLGSSKSMSAFTVIFSNGLLQSWCAFPGTPSLAERGRNDSVGSLYSDMEKAGELQTYAGRITPVSAFLQDCAARIKGVRVLAAGCDRYRKAEAAQAFDEAEIRWPLHWRGTGASSIADGSNDVRSFQRMVLERRIYSPKTIVIPSALRESEVVRKDNNPKLSKVRQHSRIDVLQSLCISAGLHELASVKSKPSFRYRGSV